MSKIKITFEIEISGSDDDAKEKASSVLIANISDTVRKTFKRLNFWTSSYDETKYHMTVNSERIDK